MAVFNVFTRLHDSIREKFLSICPYPAKTAEKLTADCIKTTSLLTGAAVLGIITMNFFLENRISVYSCICACFIVYMMFSGIPSALVEKKRGRLLHDLMGYYSAVKRKFIYSGSIPNALYEAACEQSEEIRRNASELCGILLTDDRREAVRQYIANRNKNKFLKLFLIQAYETSENGDERTPEGTSAFADNIELLRLELINEIYSCRKRRYMFSGYLFVALFPVFSIAIVKKTGLALAPELSSYYVGTGNIIIALVFFSAYLIFDILSDNSGEDEERFGWIKGEVKLKDTGVGRYASRLTGRMEENDGKAYSFIRKKIGDSGRRMSVSKVVLRMAAYFLVVLLSGVIFTAVRKNAERTEMLTKVNDIDRVAVLANERIKKKVSNAILETVKTLTENGSVKGRDAEKKALSVYRSYMGTARNFEDTALKEIERKMHALSECYIHWYEYLFLIFIAVVSGMIPIIRLEIDIGLRRKKAVDEIKRFQNVIIMERTFRTLSVVNLLTDLELFSDVFRAEIRTCINSYSSGPMEALRKLKEDGVRKCSDFQEIADGFLAIDDVGIKDAFSDAKGNRECLEKMDELDRTINRERKKEVLDIISWIPGCLLIFGYFVAPFVKTSLDELGSLFESMESSGLF
jgi:hypothetical protein